MLEQLLLGKGGVTNDVDLLDARREALGNLDAHRYAIALQRRDGGLNTHPVLAQGKILALEFLFNPIEYGAIEDAAFGQTDVLQALLQIILFDVVIAGDFDLGNGRTFLH